MPSPARGGRPLTLLALVVAGEAIFGLPFHVARFFRPTVLAVLDITNAELGGFFAAYGVLAMLSYFPGGLLADRYSARVLLTVSLASTAALGTYFATLPSAGELTLLFALFGVTTILPFWGALIRATRHWGGARDQGKAFGLLDGGRGLVAAALASAALVPLKLTLGASPLEATEAERFLALQRIILLYVCSTSVSAVLVWFAVPKAETAPAPRRVARTRELLHVLGQPRLWLQAVIVVTAYCAYKGIDNYGLFAVVAYGMDEVEGARVSVLCSWVRPFAALGAGLLADRLTPSRATLGCFALLACGFASFVLTEPGPETLNLLWVNVIVTSICAFGLRGVYFALLEESRIPERSTGTAVGIVSLVGFTPDIFIAPLMGSLLDAHPGATGHRYVFVLLGGIAMTGVLATVLLRRSLESARA